MTTLPGLLANRLSKEPSQPLITFHDDRTGERTELSVTTFENWVAKTANLLTDELMLDPGVVLAIDLPSHWLVPVFLGAAWSCGLQPVPGSSSEAEVSVVGPEPALSESETTLACALHPFATAYTEPLPPGVLDYGLLWPGQSDVFLASAATEFESPRPMDDRVLTDLHLASQEGQQLLLGVLGGSGSVVLVANAEASRWPAHLASERATATTRPDQPIN